MALAGCLCIRVFARIPPKLSYHFDTDHQSPALNREEKTHNMRLVNSTTFEANFKHLKISSLLSIAALTCICLLLVVPQKTLATESTELVAVVSRDGSDVGGGGWFARVLRELFDDIDWEAIEKAREQVEKFVRKVDRLIKTFRGNSSGDNQNRPTADLGADSAPQAANSKEARLNPQGKWWMSGAKLAGGVPASSLANELADANDVKAMLERVACYVGYMRILTNSNEALAELDAAKVVSNLFSSTSGSSSGGFFKKWFG